MHLQTYIYLGAMYEGINMEGTVKKWINRKGYGFIGVDGEKDVFVHYSDVKKDGFVSLEIGQKVKFDLVDTDKGPRAKNVEPVE